MEKYLTKRIILSICRPGINPLELCLVAGGEYKINEEDNKRLRSLLPYSF